MRPIAAGEDLPTIVQWVRWRGWYIISPAKCLS